MQKYNEKRKKNPDKRMDASVGIMKEIGWLLTSEVISETSFQKKKKSMYRWSKNTPIYFNTNYCTEMTLVPIHHRLSTSI